MNAGNVEVDVFVTMESTSMFVYLVVVLGFVAMGNKKCFARIVVVMRCARPHFALRKKKPKYDGHCFFCYVYKFPDTPFARNYMTKENTVATFHKEKFPKCYLEVQQECTKWVLQEKA